MISPELLRRYPFFGGLTIEHLKAMAMLAEEVVFEAGETIFETAQPAESLWFLLEGCVDLHYIVVDELDPKLRKDFFISEINPGEPFGISALIEPHRYTGTVRSTCVSRVLKFNAGGLRALCAVDPKIDAALMRQLAAAAMSRLYDTRVQLAAARA
ncbi:MAG TPA: cyclic nucleotide-binding domain-containing protein [Anaerolineae bacterium]|nr:cyclic nucleotide-binding domain-containing protein [Anaerolineae bacterium]